MEKEEIDIFNPKTTLSESELGALKKRVLESIGQIRHLVLQREPFIGGIMMRLTPVPVRDFRCNTAMTDGTHIFFDIDFYKRLTEAERMFVFAHEVWHVVYMHFLRRQTREHELWNVSTDCEINRMLKQSGFNSPDGLCFPEEPVKDDSAEQIYEYLLKKYKNIQNYWKQNSNNKSTNGGSGNGDSKNSGNISGQFDQHYAEDDKKKDAKGGLPKDQWGEKGIDKDFVPQITSDISEKIREMVVSEAQRYERNRGELPGYMSSIINKIRKPEINWREHLCQFVTSCIGDRRVWLPPNRHHVWSGNYFQSRKGEKINVIVTLDTSGSTTADLPKFMGELIGLVETFGNYELTLIQCDAEVQDVSTYDSYNPFPIENISSVKFSGFGGSDLRPAFDEIQKMTSEATFHIVFTDGYITVPDKNPLNIPTLFVLTSDGSENLCDWGEKTKFKETV
jgi:predicted metal-dependent peptidase